MMFLATGFAAVPTENSNSDVVMMETSEHRQRGDAAKQSLSPEVRRVFIQCEVSPDPVVISSVALQNSTQVTG